MAFGSYVSSLFVIHSLKSFQAVGTKLTDVLVKGRFTLELLLKIPAICIKEVIQHFFDKQNDIKPGDPGNIINLIFELEKYSDKVYSIHTYHEIDTRFPFFYFFVSSFLSRLSFFLSFSLSLFDVISLFPSRFHSLFLSHLHSVCCAFILFRSLSISLPLVLPSFKHTNIKRKYRDAKLWDLCRSARLAQRDMSIGLLLKYVNSHHPNLWSRLSYRWLFFDV